MLCVFLYFQNEVERISTSDQYKFQRYDGYIIDDHELSGFFMCGGKVGISFSDVGNTGMSDKYAAYKTGPREPIYVEVSGRITEDGGCSVWSPEKECKFPNFEIKELHRIERRLPIACGALLGSDFENIYHDEPSILGSE